MIGWARLGVEHLIGSQQTGSDGRVRDASSPPESPTIEPEPRSCGYGLFDLKNSPDRDFEAAQARSGGTEPGENEPAGCPSKAGQRGR